MTNEGQERRRPGRPTGTTNAAKGEETLEAHTVRLESDQWRWCERRGGGNASRYLRELIDADRREA
jgi:hypothetical protein